MGSFKLYATRHESRECQVLYEWPLKYTDTRVEKSRKTTGGGGAQTGENHTSPRVFEPNCLKTDQLCSTRDARTTSRR